MIEYDLHIHTTNSDGGNLPTEIIQKAREKRLRGIVITDHSGITYSQALVTQAANVNVTIPFPGVEISTKYDGNKFHVLAYGPGIVDENFRSFVFQPTAIKNEIYQRVIEEIRLEGYYLPTVEEILNGQEDGNIRRHMGKWMLSKTLIGQYLQNSSSLDLLQVKSILDEKYNRIKNCATERYIDTIEAIQRIRLVKAVPVLAHPWWECYSGTNTFERVQDQIRFFIEAGLIGIETVSRHHSDELNQAHTQLAHKLGLLIFAGSDYHGDGKSELGQYGISHDTLTKINDSVCYHGCQLFA